MTHDLRGEIRRDGLGHPDRFDPAVFSADAAGAGDDASPAGDHRQDVPGVGVFRCCCFAGVGVEAAGAVRFGRPMLGGLVRRPAGAAARGVRAVRPGGVAEQRVEDATRADAERAQRTDLADSRVEPGIRLHLRLLRGCRLPGRFGRLRGRLRVRLLGRLLKGEHLDAFAFVADVSHPSRVGTRTGRDADSTVTKP